MQHEFDIVQYFSLLKNKKNFIGFIVIASMLVAAGVSFLRPLTYVSRVVLLSGDQGSFSGMDSTGLSGLLLSRIGLQNSSKDTIIAIIKSRRMASDINEKFNIGKNSRAWWAIDVYWYPGTLNVEATGPDPDLTQKIANFSVENLNKINRELAITTQSQMVTVLDPASYGVSEGRKTVRNTSIAGLFSLLLMSLYFFLKLILRK